MKKPVILIILDGWGLGKDSQISAINQANTPFIDSLYHKYPHTTLEASGLAVGLPEGQMGNSEVGHINIGAGRTVYQMLVKIDKVIQEERLGSIATLKNALDYAKKEDKKVHFMGLLSDGGVHSHINHLKGLLAHAHEYGLKKVFLHAFTDGRDTDPKSGLTFIKDIESFMKNNTGELASVTGRYYAMDRDQRWQRIALAYEALVKGKGQQTKNIVSSMEKAYENDETDEFLKPLICTDDADKPLATIEKDDVVICFNFRTDRSRQLSLALSQKDFPDYHMKSLPINYLTMTEYDNTFKNIKVLFENKNLTGTLGEVLSLAGKQQIRIAETEKYPHVTFFFSGGREKPYKDEKRILCSSPKVATYDLAPEMSAEAITQKIVPELEAKQADFICLNFANPDMVGHTGVFEAAVTACETVDKCAKKVVESALKNNYAAIVIADHGNADVMINADGTPNTAHTTNLVPCFVLDNNYKGKLNSGKLANIAPTILDLMGIDKSEEMIEKSLLIH